MQPPEHRVADRPAHQRDLLTGGGEPGAELVDDRGDAHQLADRGRLHLAHAAGIGLLGGLVGHEVQLYARGQDGPAQSLALPL